MVNIFKEFIESGKDFDKKQFCYSFNSRTKNKYDVFMEKSSYRYRFYFTKNGKTEKYVKVKNSGLSIDTYDSTKDDVLLNIVSFMVGCSYDLNNDTNLFYKPSVFPLYLFKDSTKKLYKSGLGKAMDIDLFLNGNEKEYFSKEKRYDVKLVECDIDVTENGVDSIYLINDKLLTNDENKLLYDSVTNLEKRKELNLILYKASVVNLFAFDEKLAKEYVDKSLKDNNLRVKDFFMSKVKIYN